MEEINKFPIPPLVVSKIASQVYKKVLENIDQTVILDGYGNPSKYFDALETQRLVEQFTEETAWYVIGAVRAMARGQKSQISLPFTFQVAEDQGPRPKMEDKYVCEQYVNELLGFPAEPKIAIFSVYDGHGGPLTAEYVARYLHVNLLRDESFGDNIPEALREAFLCTNEFYFQYMDREGLTDNVGSTAVLTMLHKEKLWCAWAGDSEACLYRTTGEVLPLCVTHKPWQAKERERIEMMGGTVEERGGVWRVCGALAVARAFGDARYRQFITAEPDVVCVDMRGDEEYLVVACDGLWDVMSHQAVGTFLSQYSGVSKEGMTEALVQHARSLGSTDNITCIVVIFGV